MTLKVACESTLTPNVEMVSPIHWRETSHYRDGEEFGQKLV